MNGMKIICFWLTLFSIQRQAFASAPSWLIVKDELIFPNTMQTWIELTLPITPITVTIEGRDLDNCSLQEKLPRQIEISRMGKHELLSPYHPLNPKKAHRCFYRWQWKLGTEQVKDVRNCLLNYPLDPLIEMSLLQGFNTQDTHQGLMGYGLDFKAPEGSSVRAALNGVVADFNDGKQNLEEGNYVILLHPQGFLTKYTHLKLNSIKVQLGQKISTGEEIAQSGKTGFRPDGKPMMPHLHFDVFTFQAEKRQTIPFNLMIKGACFEPPVGGAALPGL
jgi:murein DD-endopeptidase MepM/ murein hydrolase activator NlpD